MTVKLPLKPILPKLEQKVQNQSEICTLPRSGQSLHYSSDIVFYVHVPFCASKCHFCYWVARIAPGDLTRNAERYEAYTQALIKEIENNARRGVYNGRAMKSIYLGGGTPSVLSGSQLARILKVILDNNEKCPTYESTTLEVSPAMVDLEKLTLAREAGYDRISMGVQLFSDELLRRQARGHTVQEAIDAYYTARQAGFDNINLDLMLGLPDTTRAEWETTIETALQLYPEHISMYVYLPAQSTVSGQQVTKGFAQLAEDADLIDQYMWASRRLNDAGYLQYAQHLFERQGKRCNCDESYFQLKEEWLGHGAGGTSFFNERVFGHDINVENYIADPTRYDFNTYLRNDTKQLWFFILRMLFTVPGIHYDSFEKRIGMSFAELRRRDRRMNDFLNLLEEKYQVESDEIGFRYAGFEATTRAIVEQRYHMGKVM